MVQPGERKNLPKKIFQDASGTVQQTIHHHYEIQSHNVAKKKK